jgi:hypothetical protein
VTSDPAQLKQRFVQMMIADLVLMLVAVGFAVAHFVYGVGWALWAFVGFIAAAFGAQLWFVRGFARTGKGS